MKRYLEQGLVLAEELSTILEGIRSVAKREAEGPLVMVAAEPAENDGYSWNLARATLPWEKLKKSEPSIFKDKKGKVVRLRKGASVIMVKFLDRSATLDNTFFFAEKDIKGKLVNSGQGLIEVRSLRVVGFESEPARLTRLQKASGFDKVVLSKETIERCDTELWEFMKGAGRWLSHNRAVVGKGNSGGGSSSSSGGGGGGD